MEQRLTPEQFCFWLQGLLDADKDKVLNKQQVQEIQDRLDIVFNKPKKLPPQNHSTEEIMRSLNQPFIMPYGVNDLFLSSPRHNTTIDDLQRQSNRQQIGSKETLRGIGTSKGRF